MTISALTRHEALAAWQQFLPSVGRYAFRRNHLEAGSVSHLSAALRHRLILEDEIIRDTLEHHSFAAAEKWLQEVCWRRYWKGWLERRPTVWTTWHARVKELRETLPPAVQERIEAVRQGAGGVACMDALALELITTGYLHNHARMWWASYWIHVERLPWELGAEFFYCHLRDADPAANTLSWRWVAGLQTPGKTYLVRLSNIEKYAPHLLHEFPEGCEVLADDAVSAAEPAAYHTADVCEPPTYPTAVVPQSSRAGLWLHDEDLVPEVGPCADLSPTAVFVGTAEGRISSSPVKQEAGVSALNDATPRAEAHFGCAVERGPTKDLAVSLAAWAVRNQLTEIIAFAPHVGPVWETLPEIRHELTSQGISLGLIRRESDVHAAHLARAGFFPFWEKMRRSLQKRIS
ncbi:MAG: FAD-binding domain-containing protein [Terrimicrobiaceae bacterium]